MKKKNNSIKLIKYIGKIITPKVKSTKKPNRIENHQPSWMYRNE